MKFSPKCRTKKLGIHTMLGIFGPLFNWERADIRPEIRPRQIPGILYLYHRNVGNFSFFCKNEGHSCNICIRDQI